MDNLGSSKARIGVAMQSHYFWKAWQRLVVFFAHQDKDTVNNATLRAALQANIQLSESSEASLVGFFDEYFGVSHDTPFGGRERELQALDA